jgi:hypothetical protein
MGRRAPGRLSDFLKLHPESEAILQHVGRGAWDLLVIDVDGTWVREVLRTPEEAEAACRDLGVPLHRDWDDPRLGRRMNARDHWGTSGGQRRAL